MLHTGIKFILIKLGEECKSRSSSLCSLLHSPVTNINMDSYSQGMCVQPLSYHCTAVTLYSLHICETINCLPTLPLKFVSISADFNVT
jgi:hypothetical protein